MFRVQHGDVDPLHFLHRHETACALVDDTWTAGGHAQSAAEALLEAGAEKIGLVLIRRHVQPAWILGGTTCGEPLESLPRQFDWNCGRRAWGSISQTGDPPMCFAIQAGNREIGRIRRNLLDLTADSERRIDRKLLLAAWIALRLDPRVM